MRSVDVEKNDAAALLAAMKRLQGYVAAAEAHGDVMRRAMVPPAKGEDPWPIGYAQGQAFKVDQMLDHAQRELDEVRRRAKVLST